MIVQFYSTCTWSSREGLNQEKQKDRKMFKVNKDQENGYQNQWNGTELRDYLRNTDRMAEWQNNRRSPMEVFTLIAF